MLKLLYVSGDSFSFGQELSGPRTVENFYEFDEYQRKHCYSGLIADKLQIPNYINTSLPGGSNQRVYRTILNDIPKELEIYRPEDIFVMISLTHPNRREFHMNMFNKWIPHMNNFGPKKHFNGLYDFWEIVTKETSNNTESYTFDFMLILAMQNFLKQNKIPYLITSSLAHKDDIPIYKRMFPKETFDQLYLHRALLEKSFHTFTAEGNFKRGPCIHPLEEGHAAWSEFLLDHIQKNNLFSNEDLR